MFIMTNCRRRFAKRWNSLSTGDFSQSKQTIAVGDGMIWDDLEKGQMYVIWFTHIYCQKAFCCYLTACLQADILALEPPSFKPVATRTRNTDRGSQHRLKLSKSSSSSINNNFYRISHQRSGTLVLPTPSMPTPSHILIVWIR